MLELSDDFWRRRGGFCVIPNMETLPTWVEISAREKEKMGKVSLSFRLVVDNPKPVKQSYVVGLGNSIQPNYRFGGDNFCPRRLKRTIPSASLEIILNIPYTSSVKRMLTPMDFYTWVFREIDIAMYVLCVEKNFAFKSESDPQE